MVVRALVRLHLLEFAGCWDEPTEVAVVYEDGWRSDAARPLYMAPRRAK
jgi:hypothetical protein